MTVKVKNIIDKSNAITSKDGLSLFETLQNRNQSKLTIDFRGLKGVTTSFLNSSLGKYISEYPSIDIDFRYPSNSSIIKDKVEMVKESAALYASKNNSEEEDSIN